MNGKQYNRLADQVRRRRIRPGNGIQLGQYSAGQALSISQGMQRRRAGTRNSVTPVNGWHSWNAIVTARVDYAGGATGGATRKLLEWRHAVKDGAGFRLALPTEREYMNVADAGSTMDLRPIPQYGVAVNLPDLSLQYPTRAGDGSYDYWATTQWNPWTPQAGDVIRVYADKAVIAAQTEDGFCCNEYTPQREEKIYVTWFEYASSNAVTPVYYSLNRSLIGEPDIDEIIYYSNHIYQEAMQAGRPRQSAMSATPILAWGGPWLEYDNHNSEHIWDNSGTSMWTPVDYGGADSGTAGTCVDPLGTFAIAYYRQVSGQYKLKLARQDIDNGLWSTVILDTQATNFYVQHVASDSAGVVHILARNSSTGAYRYVTSDGVAEVPTTTVKSCALALSPAGVPNIIGHDSAGVFGLMQRIAGVWTNTPTTSTYANGHDVDLCFGADGAAYYSIIFKPPVGVIYLFHINSIVDGVQTILEATVAPSGDYDSSSRTRMAVDARGYPVIAVSRLVSGNNYECDLWIWKRDGLNDTYQSATIGNPYQLGAVHVVGGRGYDQ